jgi:GTPase SAR1 family protein
LRYCKNVFSSGYHPTLHSDHFVKTAVSGNGNHVELLIWDIGGQ